MKVLLQRIRILVLVSLCAFSAVSYAQQPSGDDDLLGRNVTYEFGGYMGNLLPNQIDGLSEITGLGGVRAGWRIAPDGFAEFSFTSGNGNGAKWKNLSASLRMETPVDTMVGIMFIGGDVVHYEGIGRDAKVFGGGHIGGGLMAMIGGIAWVRTEMKFNVNPGTSLYISLGLMFRL